jgi:hypothetical protein
MMRTTLDIDDFVLLAAKEIARRKNTTAGAVISDLARQALTEMSPEPSSIAGSLAFYGFQPIPIQGRLVSNEAVDNLREDEGV